ncbi:MAG TPA: SpoIIE family protein phosphatase [Kouleothrix sp.]|jgi:sigma-B regulation protein RsbU (phosphoserine phosphatase)|nr:SpoIIE family protein phosphatase [Kouleothrix sp.]
MPALTDAQQRVAELTTLNELAQTLNRALDLREALDAALPKIVEIMGLRTGWIFLRDETGTFKLAARHELPPAILYPGPAWSNECSCQELCQTGKLTKAVNMVRCSRLRHAVGDKRSLAQHASVPLPGETEVLGILNVATSEYGRFTPPQLQLLSAIGYMLGTAITRTRLHEQVKVRRVQEQAALLKLSQELLGAESIEPALQRLVRVGARLLEADACAFIEADEQEGRAVLLAAHGWHYLPKNGLPVALDTVNPHLWYLPETSADLATDALDDLPQLLQAQRFKGHLALNIEIGGAPVGTLMINTHTPRQFLIDEAQLLGLLGSQLAQTLERERLHQEALARQRLEQELNLARDIQASFLPAGCPVVPGYTIAAFYRAARQVGGDFYDFIELANEQPTNIEHSGEPMARGQAQPKGALPGNRERELEFWRTGRMPPRAAKTKQPIELHSPGRLGIVIADVTDKGVPAALFMALSRTLIRATASDGRAPVGVLERANRLILSDARSGLFVTCFYAILDIESGDLLFADGGHNYPLHYRQAQATIEPLQTQGIVLGIVPDARFEQHATVVEPGDVICFYTDGVTEAMNPRRQLFGEERLAEILRRSHHLGPEEIIERIIDAVTNYTAGAPQTDDITLVVLKRNAS